MSSPEGEEHSRSRSKAKSAKSDYRIKHALRPPRTTMYTAQSLYDQILEGNIDLSPEYQRDVVWSEQKQVNLVDSIFRNFYMPPLIFAVSIAEDGTERRTCIDGKQRLTSIQKFMDGLIYHRDPDSPADKYWYTKKGNARGYLLPVKYQRLFANKQVVCIEYHGLSDDDEREIFRRVQLGMALTNAEKLKAESKNAKTDLIQELTNEYTTRLADVGFKVSRDGVYRHISTAIFTIKRGLSNRSPASFEQVRKWVADKSKISEVFMENIRESMALLLNAFETPGVLEVTQGPKTVATNDFVMGLALVYLLRDRLSEYDLATSITHMRLAARRKGGDIMWNRGSLAPYFDFIEQLNKSGALHTKKEDSEQMEVDELDHESEGPIEPPVEATIQEEIAPTPPKSRLAAIQAAKSGKPVPTTPSLMKIKESPTSQPRAQQAGIGTIQSLSMLAKVGPNRSGSTGRDERYHPYRGT